MVHPHDIYSHVEPWTVRIEHLAREYVTRGHEVRLVYFPLDIEPPHLRERDHPDGYRTVPLCRWRKKLFTNCAAMRDIARWADVVHVQKCHPWAFVPAAWGAYREGKPLHYDWDDWELAIYNYSPPSIGTGYFLAWFEGLAPGLADTVSVASAELRRLALEAGIAPRLLSDGHVGADTRVFHPDHDGASVRRLLGLEGRTVAMYLGQLHGAQYAELFLHAARHLANVRPESDLAFVVVGYGGRFEELKQLARTLGLEGKLQFTGSIEHVKVPSYLAAADIVVACFEDNEQQRSKSPLKIAEYMACGKAIVASRVGEVPRMLGDAGVLVEPGNAWAIAREIDALAADPARRAALGRAARARAVARFDWRTTASNLLEAYTIAIDERARARKGVFGRMRDFLRTNRDVAGVIDGAAAFAGPESVQVDLTDRCNSDCISCWTHSPLVRDPDDPPKAELPWSAVETLLTDLAKLGTRQVYFSGGGDPTVHARWLDAVVLAKRLGLRAIINSNMTLLGQSELDALVATGIDRVIASVWAATGEAYARTHPSKPAEVFTELTASLRYLCDRKQPTTKVKLYNVISPVNVDEIEAMVAYACEVGADEVELTPTDSVAGRTEILHLSPAEIARALAQCERIRAIDHHNRLGHRVVLYEIDTFVKRLSSPGAPVGLYEQDTINTRGCYVGWTFARIHADGHVAPCLKCHKVDLGNINEQRFAAIWDGAPERRFRALTRNFATGDPFFALVGNDPSQAVGCFKSCDDRGRNWDMQRKLDHLGGAKSALLGAARYAMRRVR